MSFFSVHLIFVLCILFVNKAIGKCHDIVDTLYCNNGSSYVFTKEPSARVLHSKQFLNQKRAFLLIGAVQYCNSYV